MWRDLDQQNASIAWDRLCECMDAFIAAWESDQSPPEIAAFLPDGPQELRNATLVELIKIDLEYRWLHHGCPKSLEEYAAEFPEIGGRQLPCDLIYEEYHVRKQLDAALTTEEYRRRFAEQAESFQRLLDLRAPQVSTALARRRPGGREALPADDDFEVLDTLGSGAFAVVYLARQRSMQRLVALKVTAPRGEEPQTMAQLDHPNIVRVYDQRLSRDGLSRLLYMELAPGGTLQAVCDAVRQTTQPSGTLLLNVVDRHLNPDRGYAPLPRGDPHRARLAAMDWSEVVCWLGFQLSGALAYAHREGVLHRDLKPANVLLAEDGRPKLADFNISYCSKLDGAAPAAYFGGSLAYMSPEQMDACNPNRAGDPADLDGRSDLYSLAVVLWELLTGERPFDDERLEGGWADSLDELSRRRRRGVAVEAIGRLPARTPAGFRDALLRCLAADPDQRPHTAGELCEELRLALRPKLQKLVRPRHDGWQGIVGRHLVSMIVLAGLVPNAIHSALVIGYNWFAVVSQLDPVAQHIFLRNLLIALNGVFYPLAAIVGLWAAMPVLKAARSPPERSGDGVRRRSLNLGDWVFWITVACWAAGGVVFPICLHLSGGAVSASTYLHFIASHCLAGLIAGVLCFFLLTFLNVRFVYPRLLLAARSESLDVEPLRALLLRVGRYERIAAVAPFLAAILLGVAQSDFRGAFGGLAAIGMAGLAASSWLARAIRSDGETLAAASVDVP